MKKFYFLLLAAVFAVSADVYAQGESKIAQASAAAPDCSGENFYVGYNIVSVEWNVDQRYMEEEYPLNSGITAGYNKRMGLNVSSFPLYVDYGANFSYMFGSSEDIFEEDDYEGKYKTSVNVASINVPLAVTTPFQVDNITILPYVGVNLRFNLFGKQKETVEASYDGEDLSNSETYDLFNKDDMGGYPFGRFQVGLNLGVNIEFEKYTVGIGYVNDFSPVYDVEGLFTGTFSAATISVGYKF